MKNWVNNALWLIVGMAFCLIAQLITGLGQDVPGAGGLTRYQLAKMLYDCDRIYNKPEGFCVADVNIRPNDLASE